MPPKDPKDNNDKKKKLLYNPPYIYPRHTCLFCYCEKGVLTIACALQGDRETFSDIRAPF